ncbi:50S ribosome-binding GTPase [Ceratobasidium sp. AG-Ba]|nr:50S ribosome-binding GTPase [Ceratobasidium sp. AG-Ba]
MPRKVAFSAKKRKVQLQEKRAIKRGEVPATVAEKSKNKRKRGKRPPADNEAALAAAARTRMLVSSFLKPSPEFLEASKEAAATEILVRPIPESSRILRVGSDNEGEGLVCPRRPKWRYKMTKEEVEKNEEGLFAKWTTQTDEAINSWRQANIIPSKTDSGPGILPAPTYYERNLEVWRQLWRVCELSSILMLLLDARCPPLHYPPSIDAYIKSLRPTRQVILVLTKIDIVGEECAEAWKKWLREKYGGNGVQIVGVQSYQEVSYGIGQGSRMKYQPHMPPNLLGELQAALKRAHEALLEPPALVKEDPEKLKNWRPAVRTQVNWEAIGQKDHFQGVNIPPARDELPTDDERHDAEENDNDDAPSKEYLQDHFLTIGLIGQPNVGKSSLLNALFGEHKVKTSRTPGKTKHFQTLFLTPEIRLVDCPGLVLPALIPMELQVLSNILPIAQIPALPACIHYVGNLMPIEEIFGVDQSMLEPEEVVEDKRTWRAGMQPREKQQDTQKGWTALHVMNAYATKRGWQTARTAWPDAMRGGNAMMRSIVEGKVHWSFWPPGSNPPPNGLGIWSQGRAHEDEEDVPSSGEEHGDIGSEEEEPEDGESARATSEEGEEEGEQPTAKATIGRFAALELDEDAEEDNKDDKTD